MTPQHHHHGSVAASDDCGCGGPRRAIVSAAVTTPASLTPARARRAAAPAGPPVRSGTPLHPLERNAFYPRKLMSVENWQLEQGYHRNSRELITRLTTGCGVLCGLEVELSTSGTVVIAAGAAVDGAGRIIVVPSDIDVDPTRITDDCGKPTAEVADDGPVTISVCFHECGIDPVAIPEENCGDDVDCVPDRVRETFSIRVVPGEGSTPGLTDELCTAFRTGHAPDAVEGSEPEDRRALLDRLAPRSCGCGCGCVDLAVVRTGDDGARVVDTTVRTVIRSNAELLDLILCLADRLDDCCGTVTVAPPQVTALWPWPDVDDTALARFLKEQRIELAFDRDIAEQGLDDPDTWLGAWLVGKKGAFRGKLTRASGSLAHVAAPTGGDAAAYGVEFPEGWSADSVALILARSTVPGPIRAAGSDQLALDADLAATGLTPAQLDQLWGIGAGGSDPALAPLAVDAVTNPPIGVLPSGEGSAGGDLHVVLRKKVREAPPLRLLSVWPAGGTVFGPNEPDTKSDYERFREEQTISIDVSRPLSRDAVKDPSGWLRVAIAGADGDRLFGIQYPFLELVEEVPLPNGAMRYRFRITEVGWVEETHFILQLRATPPLTAGSPVGADAPALLLDADFDGNDFPGRDPESQLLFSLWNGDPFDGGLPRPVSYSTIGEELWDRFEGGLAHWAFLAYKI